MVRGCFVYRFGINLGWSRDRFGMVLGLFWYRFGMVLGWCWVRFRVGPGPFGVFWGRVWPCFAHVLRTFWQSCGMVWRGFVEAMCEGGAYCLAYLLRRSRPPAGRGGKAVGSSFETFADARSLIQQHLDAVDSKASGSASKQGRTGSRESRDSGRGRREDSRQSREGL